MINRLLLYSVTWALVADWLLRMTYPGRRPVIGWWAWLVVLGLTVGLQLGGSGLLVGLKY